MIEWISQWLQNIILVVLLATFVDLLLPSSKMQKYSKMVLGLIVILSIITPVFSIFSKDFTVEAITKSIENGPIEETNIPVMSSEQGKDQPNRDYQSKMIEQVEVSMKQHLQSILENRFQVSVNEVKLLAEIDQKQNWVIQQVQVYMKEGNAETDSQAKNSDKIEEVKNIEITAVNTTAQNIGKSSSVEINNEKYKETNQRLQEQIVQVIKEQWGLKEEQILVNIEQD